MKKNSLQFELSLKISLFFIMIMLAVSSGTIAYLSNRYNKIIIDDMNSNLVNAVSTIDYYFDDVKTPMVMISRNSSIQRVLKNYQGMTNREKLDTVNQLEDFVQNITTFKSFINDIIVVGVNGYLYNIYRESPDKYIGDYDFLNSRYLADSSVGPVGLTFTGQHPTDYYMSASFSEVYSVVLPIRSGQNRIGYVICDLKSETINNILNNNLKEEQAKILIRDEKGEILYEEGNEKILAEEVVDDKNRSNETEASKKNIFEILFARGNYVTSVTSEVTGWTYYYAESYETINSFLKKVFMVHIVIIAGMLAVITFFSNQLSRLILKPLKNIAFMIREMKINQGDYRKNSYNAGGQNVNELSIEIEQMITRLESLINENYLYELKAKDAQIQVLTNQLSPHFLYNTLQLIEYQSYHHQTENITTIINGLSYILRYSFRSESTVWLGDELQYIKCYLDIYSLRYENRLTYEIDADEDSLQAEIPRMILEPVVENCIKHGFAGELMEAVIRVQAAVENQELYIRVTDNGKGMNRARLEELRRCLEQMSVVSEHIGLNNVYSILKLRYGDRYGLDIDSELGQFTTVTLHMPFIRP